MSFVFHFYSGSSQKMRKIQKEREMRRPGREYNSERFALISGTSKQDQSSRRDSKEIFKATWREKG